MRMRNLLWLALPLVVCGSAAAVQEPVPASRWTIEQSEIPRYSLEVRVDGLDQIQAALNGFARRSGYALTYQDLPGYHDWVTSVPASRIYDLRHNGAHINAANPFDSHIFFVGIYADENQSREICRNLVDALNGAGLVPGPPRDFGTSPPTCPGL
jgi:hypothetical protein